MVAVTGGSAESERNDREERREQEGGVGTPPALVKSISRCGSSNRKANIISSKSITGHVFIDVCVSKRVLGRTLDRPWPQARANKINSAMDPH